NNTIGFDNTALGAAALYYNDIGKENTAIGRQALFSNTAGIGNTATGYKALRSNTASGRFTFGNYNTANGWNSLCFNTLGSNNTAFGISTLYSNTIGGANTATGSSALHFNTTGAENTASGTSALSKNVNGNSNSAFGSQSGPNSPDFSNTTCIGFFATATASNQIVLGNKDVTQVYCYGAFAGTTAAAANLVVLNNGQIARSTSSRRYKKDIAPMEINTTNIYKLRPVSYDVYTDDSRHFGLLAEDVAEVIPELAMFSKEKDVVNGSTSEKMIPDAVQYPLLSVLILKEVQKHEQTINEQQKQIEEMKKALLTHQQQNQLLLKRLELLEKKN
ncbi:MAG: tail fiber domain-containing protein, partial [Bacteroidota bacterium]